MSAADYASQLVKLLPPGRLFDGLEADADLRATCLAIAEELERVRVRGIDLVDESDPRTADETIADWERMLDLPDLFVTTIPGTLTGRQVAVTQKYVNRGGQNYTFFETLCAACGWPLLSIDRFANSGFRVGNRIGDRFYDAAWAYAMQVNVSATPTAGALTSAQFEAVVRHATHSHITVVFTYA